MLLMANEWLWLYGTMQFELLAQMMLTLSSSGDWNSDENAMCPVQKCNII